MHVQVAVGASARVERTVRLLHDRGYCLPLADVARLCVGGPVPPSAVEAAVATRPALRLTAGLVHLASDDAHASAARQVGHGTASPALWAEAVAYADRLARHCPWLRVAWVAGSMASGGFEQGDDIDFNLLVEDDAKYLSYMVALAVAVPVSWRLRRQAGDRSTPFLPKVVCINVVWEEHQAAPFVRTDGAMGMEVLLSRPVYGRAHSRRLLAANPALTRLFPQLLAQNPDGDAGAAAGAYADAEVDADTSRTRLSPAGRLLALLTRIRWIRRGLDAGAYLAVRVLHAYVRFHRRKRPDVLRHVDEMEAHKAPYGILQRPRRIASASR